MIYKLYIYDICVDMTFALLEHILINSINRRRAGLTFQV